MKAMLVCGHKSRHLPASFWIHTKIAYCRRCGTVKMKDRVIPSWWSRVRGRS